MLTASFIRADDGKALDVLHLKKAKRVQQSSSSYWFLIVPIVALVVYFGRRMK